MGIEIKRGYCSTREQALEEILQLGLWPFAQDVDPGEEDLEPHWHTWDTHIYMLEGEFESIDPADGSRTRIGAGDYQFVPARVLHSAKVTKKSRLIAGLSEPINFGRKTNFSADEL